MKKSIKAILLAVLLVVAVSAAAQTMYTITDLGTLGGDFSAGTAISKSGLVAGYSHLQDNTTNHAFLYSNGGLTDIGTVSGTSVSFAFGVNDAGQVTGESYTDPGQKHAFLYSNGAVTDIGTLGGPSSAARGINASGQITGFSALLSGNSQAFLYSNGTMTDIGTPDVSSGGQAINDAGEITGNLFLNDGNQHAFLYSNGVMTDLGAMGGLGSVGLAINASRQITGFFYASLGNGPAQFQHAFLYSNGTTTDIGTLGGIFSVGFGINASGQITGQSSLLPGDFNEYAFVYSNGTMKDLNDLLPSGSGWVLATASAINDAGQITGAGFNPSGVEHGFLLTPIYKALVQPPINADGSSIFKANRGVIPVKFSLTENNTPTCDLPPATISVTRTAGGVIGSVDESTYSMAADNGPNFRIDPTACQYVYNLAASSLGVGTYRVDISINGIMVGHAVFALK